MFLTFWTISTENSGFQMNHILIIMSKVHFVDRFLMITMFLFSFLKEKKTDPNLWYRKHNFDKKGILFFTSLFLCTWVWNCMSKIPDHHARVLMTLFSKLKVRSHTERVQWCHSKNILAYLYCPSMCFKCGCKYMTALQLKILSYKGKFFKNKGLTE